MTNELLKSINRTATLEVLSKVDVTRHTDINGVMEEYYNKLIKENLHEILQMMKDQEMDTDTLLMRFKELYIKSDILGHFYKEEVLYVLIRLIHFQYSIGHFDNQLRSIKLKKIMKNIKC